MIRYQSQCDKCGWAVRADTEAEAARRGARHACSRNHGDATCSAERCDAPASRFGSTLCPNHEKQRERYGYIPSLDELNVRITTGQPCAGCSRPLWPRKVGVPDRFATHATRGFCTACRDRAKRTGRGLVPIPVRDPALEAFIAARRARGIPARGLAA